LLFTLRKVDQQDLIAKAGSDLAKTRKAPVSTRVLASDDLSDMFGIEIAPAPQPKHAAATKPAPTLGAGKPVMPPAKRRAISARMKKYWAARRALKKK
jgi:hypothetical protein